MSRKDARIEQLETQLKLALEAVASLQNGTTAQRLGIEANHAAYEAALAERDAAFGPLREENQLLRHDNAQLRNQFRGFVDSIEWWKSELAEGFDR